MAENKVYIMQDSQIRDTLTDARMCIEWVRESFLMKNDAQLPAKISVHPADEDFFTSMPCLLPAEYGRFGVKEVYRIVGRRPSLGSDILLYDSVRGDLLAMMDGDRITMMRTGAVAALAIRMFKKKGADTYSMMGLGNTARAVAMALIADNRGSDIRFRLLRYKDQAELFAERFKDCEGVTFEIIDDMDTFISGADVIVSCVTAAGGGLFCADDSLFREGVLLVPVHTRGFQNCDLFFDKVFGDDTGHVRGFRYFDRFREFHEISDVLAGRCAGRTGDNERIISYNIGIGLHDVLFASKIFDMADKTKLQCVSIDREDKKFWI